MEVPWLRYKARRLGSGQSTILFPYQAFGLFRVVIMVRTSETMSKLRFMVYLLLKLRHRAVLELLCL